MTKRSLLCLLIFTLLAFALPTAQEEKGRETLSYKDELVQREAEYIALIEEMRKFAPKYAAIQYPQPKNYDQIADIVLRSPDAALVEYLVGDRFSALWVLTQPTVQEDGETAPGLEVFVLDREKLIETARAFHKSVSNPLSQDHKELGRALYDIILKPAEPYLAGKKHLYVVPDGILYYVPFEALLNSKSEYLIDVFNITYAPSASVLAEIFEEVAQKRAPKAAGKISFLGVGDPIFSKEELFKEDAFRGDEADLSAEAETPEEELITTRSLYENRGYQFQRLPYTGVEIEEISAIFKDKPKEVLLREKAREEEVKGRDLTRYRIIHFATHGVLDEEVPLRSGVVLSLVPQPGQKESKEDGFLQMAEIFNIRMDADLVTLSACQTGLGKVVRGEGMVGLTRAFLYAGTPTVLVSLWNVNDLTTSHLMKNFYDYLEKGKSKSDALRQARRDMVNKKIDITPLKRKHAERDAQERGVGGIRPGAVPKAPRLDASHPYHWAAFILVGYPH